MNLGRWMIAHTVTLIDLNPRSLFHFSSISTCTIQDQSKTKTFLIFLKR